MADTFTTNLSLVKPQDGVEDTNKSWGLKLNENSDKLDTVIANQHNADGTHKAGVIDHGGLDGLVDDDHSQYLNSARHTKVLHDALGLSHASLSDLLLNDNPHNVTKANITLGNVVNTLSYFAAIVPPTVTDDSAAGYSVGSLWVDITANKVYICVDNTNDTAIWKGIVNTQTIIIPLAITNSDSTNVTQTTWTYFHYMSSFPASCFGLDESKIVKIDYEAGFQITAPGAETIWGKVRFTGLNGVEYYGPERSKVNGAAEKYYEKVDIPVAAIVGNGNITSSVGAKVSAGSGSLQKLYTALNIYLSD